MVLMHTLSAGDEAERFLWNFCSLFSTQQSRRRNKKTDISNMSAITVVLSLTFAVCYYELQLKLEYFLSCFTKILCLTN